MAKKKSKWKKIAKNVGKAAAIAGALYGGSKLLGKRKLSKAVSGTDDAGKGVSWYNHPLDNIPRGDPTTVSPDFSLGASAAKGGRIGKKGGGRIGKQFGGGLGRTARRDMRSGYYPSDMGMRGGPMYKKGGRVKSRGAAKRGGGAEIK